VRWRIWASAAFGGGCALYLGLKSEPSLWPLLVAASIACGAWQVVRRRGAGPLATVPLMLVACFAMGIVAGKMRTEAVAGPIAPAMERPTVVEAWVLDVDSPGERGARVVIAPVRVRGLAPEETPIRLRATVRGEPPEPGESVSLYGLLNPPPSPASPGAYDFGRNAYFQGMGGVLFTLGETRSVDLAPPPWRLRLMMRINAVRYALAQRIVARLGERTGGVAAAMTTGHETWIAAPDLEMMRDSGLAHILSISGLHMAIVGGFVFFSTRLAVAAVPSLALRVSSKKLAAVAGLIAVGAYLVLSGAPPPAERAAITASVAFLAVLLNRQAISMHALGVAAFVVLLIHPEAVATPGFQMSFAATAALVALAESWPARTRELNAPLPILFVQRGLWWLAAACMASLVAGMATSPFAMQHFNRTAIYGLLANLAVTPVSSFLMMPMLALGAMLEPLGLGGPFLKAAGWGVDVMLAIGGWTAGLPGAVRTIPSAPAIALPIAFLGILHVCLWKGRARWLGAPFAAAVLLMPRADPPDLWIGDSGTNAAYRTGPEATVIRPAVRRFAVDIWSRRRGLEVASRKPEEWICRRTSCAPVSADVAPVALWWGRRTPTGDELDALCQAAEVVSSRAPIESLPASCQGRLILDGDDYARGGSVELWRSADGSAWRALWTAEERGARPWSRLGDPDYQ
jgi:competence protein ComEC